MNNARNNALGNKKLMPPLDNDTGILNLRIMLLASAANLGTRILMKELSTLTIPDQYASIASTDVTVSE